MPQRAATPAVADLLDRVHNLTGQEPGTFTPSQVMRAVDDHLAPRVKVGQPIDAATVAHYAAVLTERSLRRGRTTISLLYLAVIGYPILPEYVTREVGLFIGKCLQNLTELSRYVHPEQIERRRRWVYRNHIDKTFEPFEGFIINQDRRRENGEGVRRESTYSDIRRHFIHNSETTGAEKGEAVEAAGNYQTDALGLSLYGGHPEDPDRIAEAVKAMVDQPFAHLFTGETFESKRPSIIQILGWVDRNGVTPRLIMIMREHIASSLIYAGDYLTKTITPVHIVMSAVIPAIETLMRETVMTETATVSADVLPAGGGSPVCETLPHVNPGSTTTGG